MKKIENNPALRERIIEALKVTDTPAFKKEINHPLANLLIPYLEDL
ncbi:MAG: hypothetical protein PUP92_12380 [Rhizonema sp. PD38]|nr:hypothetical protein [Rhizonema sp. PD38]